MPSEIEKTFGKIIEATTFNCSHSTAVLSLGNKKGICMQCGTHVKTVTVNVYDMMYLQSDGTIMPYPKRVWREQ